MTHHHQLEQTLKKMMTASPSKDYSGQHKATKKEDDQGLEHLEKLNPALEEEMWKAGFRFSWRKMAA